MSKRPPGTANGDWVGGTGGGSREASKVMWEPERQRKAAVGYGLEVDEGGEARVTPRLLVCTTGV